ncbi:hypothetical protein [Streptomyces sp. TLI_171]|uniref:hypothetical protein n=1 Tax=Streptomyces sp. TLI_171 TaxID=1938859 RepID=UPI000C456FE9|nr:hypothetical protein [Streptomyces sp. TLI_171]RKE17608.1 hypothetical protein BX266_0869 [Streptomyces sp. TLI_171]
MRRRTVVSSVVLAGAAFVVAAGSVVGWRDDPSKETTGLRTDRAPMERRFHRFGELLDVHWVYESPGAGDRMLPITLDHPLTAVLQLEPGQVNRLIGDRQRTAVSMPGHAGAVQPVADGRSALLAPYIPRSAAWVKVPELERLLVRAEYVSLSFDPASDTVLVDTIDPSDPDEAYETVDPWGNTTTVTPSPFVPPS